MSELVALIDAAYAEGEAGLWHDGMPRTDEDDIAAAERAGEMLVVTGGDRVLGCARVHALDDATAEVGLVAVATDAWGDGIGRAIMDAAEDAARARGATTLRLSLLVPREGVHPFKQRLHDWYRSRGYEVVGSTPFEDAVPHAAPYLTAPGDVRLSSTNPPPIRGSDPLSGGAGKAGKGV